jgi:capsular polysaccharide biosynthesis protein
MFFGPLLVDDFSLELNALDPNENIKMVTKPYHHEAEYRQLLGLQQTRLVEFGNVRELILYEEPAINSLKRNKYFELRQRLTRNVKGLYAQNKYIYLKRGSSGEKRILHNEREIEELLNSLGFIIVEPSSMSVREIVEKTINAKIVVTVEGSHISHVVFTMSPNGAMVVLQPPDRFSAVYKEIADCLGIKYAFLVGDPVEQGFKIDKNDVQRILDIINF